MSIEQEIRAAVAEALEPIIANLTARFDATIAELRRPRLVAYTLTEAGEALGVSLPTVRAMIKAGELPVVVLPTMTERRVPVAAVQALVADDRWSTGVPALRSAS